VDAVFKFPKLLENVVGIMKIAKSIEADGQKKNQVAPRNKVDLTYICPEENEHKYFDLSYQHKGQTKGTTSNECGTQGGNPPVSPKRCPHVVLSL
jgi:hypothetical protein